MIDKIKLLICMASFGTISLFVKNVPLASSEIALYRAIIAFLVLGIYVLITKGLSSIFDSKGQLMKIFLSGVAMGFNWILLFEAYNYTSVALSTLCYYFAPVIVVVMSSILFKERLSLKQIICFLGSTAGLVLIIGVSAGGSNDLVGVIYGLGAAILYATVLLLNKSTGDVDSITRTIIQFVSAIVVILPYVGVTNGFHLNEIGVNGMISLIIVGAFHTGILYVMLFSSVSRLRGQEVAILSYVDPLVAVLVSIVILNETVTIAQLLGGSAILFFTLLNELPNKKTNLAND